MFTKMTKTDTRWEISSVKRNSDEAEQLTNFFYTFLATLRMRVRDCVDVSNCTMGLFWGTNFGPSFLRNSEIANNGSDSVLKTILWCCYFRDTKPTQSHAELQKSWRTQVKNLQLGRLKQQSIFNKKPIIKLSSQSFFSNQRQTVAHLLLAALEGVISSSLFATWKRDLHVLKGRDAIPKQATSCPKTSSSFT